MAEGAARSLHGYDIVDHHELNPELGDECGVRCDGGALSHANGLGQILDFVPNHMGVGGADNPLWLDVLEWGRDSQLTPDGSISTGSRTVSPCTTNCWCRFSATNMAWSSTTAS